MRSWASFLLLATTLLLLRNSAFAEANTYSTLKLAESFAIGGVGVAGTITPHELEMRKLRGSAAEGEDQLRKLLRESTPAAQMYALFALRQRGAADYKELSEPYRNCSTPVQVISGCIIHTDSMSNVVSWIDQWATKIRTWEKP